MLAWNKSIFINLLKKAKFSQSATHSEQNIETETKKNDASNPLTKNELSRLLITGLLQTAKYLGVRHIIFFK